jgi:predicted nucleic acid-binding protein
LKLGAKSVVIADANVLLAAIAGKAAYKAFASGLDIHTTAHTWAEVAEYIPVFQERYQKTIEEIDEAFAKAPVTVHERKDYAVKLAEAEVLMAKKDPEDVDVAALALSMDAPVWSNDNDFKDFPTGRFTTAQLLKVLGL